MPCLTHYKSAKCNGSIVSRKTFRRGLCFYWKVASAAWRFQRRAMQTHEPGKEQARERLTTGAETAVIAIYGDNGVDTAESIIAKIFIWKCHGETIRFWTRSLVVSQTHHDSVYYWDNDVAHNKSKGQNLLSPG